MSDLRIGFIGLGDQGGPMARMMIEAGLDVAVWARRPEAALPFAALGARVAETPAGLAGTVDVLCLCVVGDDDVLELTHDAGLLDGLAAGAILVVHSTVLPATCERLARDTAARGVHFLEAPVSGSGRAALARTLTVMAGGDRAVLDRVQPLFDTYAGRVTHFGAAGMAMRAKLFNNLLSAANMGAAVLALDNGRELGLDADDLRNTLLAGTARSFGLEALERFQVPERAAHIARIVSKDLGLAAACLDDATLTPLHTLAQGFIARLGDWAAGRNLLLSPDPAA